MKITCPHVYMGLPEHDIGKTMWGYLQAAERISCVRDGSMFALAAICNGREVLIAEIGIGLWRNKPAVAETLAMRGGVPGTGYFFTSRVKSFMAMDISWLGD